MGSRTTPLVTAAENEDARQAWDGADGDYWTEHEETFDASLGRYGEVFREAAGVTATDRVLDVGCGTGATTRDAARAAVAGSALGVDLSARMLERARRRAEEAGLANASFLQADAQIHPFDPASFDVVISRTGVMFFGDPPAAFANLAQAVRPGGRLAFLVWQGLEGNEWFREFRSALAAGRELPSPPAGAPGPFLFADRARGEALLRAAGWADVAFAAHDLPMWFGPDGDSAYAFVAGMGFTQFMLRDVVEPARSAALDALRASIARHATANGVLYPSAAWLVTARRP
jgi:SAM-dependent methyltransferase